MTNIEREDIIMDNVKYIKQFLTENSDLCRMVCNTGETIKLPNPYLGFRQETEFGNTFKVFSVKTFVTYLINIQKINDKVDTYYFEIREPDTFVPKILVIISDDEDVFVKGSTSDIPYNAYVYCFDEERDVCDDIIAYVKAGVQQYYHKKEEEKCQ